ncbi:ROK family protein [Candidatus Pacebacteria bacterium]|nr:ROK family protein [Candidatus Paceibacterota bacterium]
MDILFDIGGSRIRFTKVIGDHNIADAIIIKTPDTYIDSIAEIEAIVKQLADGEQVNHLIGGIAGVLAKDGSKLLVSPNLRDWEKKPLMNDLKRITGADNVVIKNDTDMTGLGEAVYGAGRDASIVAYMTFSTGIGGSLIVDEKVAPYSFGFEPGFQIINDETYKQLRDVSGSALKKNFGGKLFRDIKGELTRKEIMKTVIAGINNTIAYWSPDVVVLGGGMTESFVIEDIKEELEKIAVRFPELPEIKFAEIEDTNGLYGGLAYRNQLLKS